MAVIFAVLRGILPLNAQSLPTPPVIGPLQTASPHTFDAGPFGPLEVNGIVSGFGLSQGNHVSGDDTAQADLSNGQIFLQKTKGWWQFYLQAGVYSIPALATPYLSTVATLSDFWGPVPVGYLKLAPSKNFSILVGELPSLMGAEYTFTFQNMQIERGLLWNQTSSMSRGIQINENLGHFTGSISWNDGFSSNRYTWLTGSLTYAFNGADTLSIDGGANLGQTRFRNLATPVQNNGSIFNVIYTHTKGSWTIQPDLQFTDVPSNQKAGVVRGATTRGAAVLVNYRFPHQISLAGRGEYISSTGESREAVNLIFGPGSSAWSLTATPTFQAHGFFLRGEFSLVEALGYVPGDAFGPRGTNRMQFRGLVEAGFLF